MPETTKIGLTSKYEVKKFLENKIGGEDDYTSMYPREARHGKYVIALPKKVYDRCIELTYVSWVKKLIHKELQRTNGPVNIEGAKVSIVNRKYLKKTSTSS